MAGGDEGPDKKQKTITDGASNASGAPVVPEILFDIAEITEMAVRQTTDESTGTVTPRATAHALAGARPRRSVSGQ